MEGVADRVSLAMDPLAVPVSVVDRNPLTFECGPPVVAVTFTDKAADELRSRIRGRVAERGAKPEIVADHDRPHAQAIDQDLADKGVGAEPGEFVTETLQVPDIDALRRRQAAGTAGDDPTITLVQAQDVAATGEKPLNFTRIDTKQGADLTAVGTFTTVIQAAANTYTDATSAEVQAIWVIDIKSEDLDVDNGFDCIKASVSDVGTNAQLGCLLYIGHDPRLVAAPLASAIAN